MQNLAASLVVVFLLQHLDVLVRDWFYPPTYGFQGGQDYLQDTIQVNLL